MIIALHGNLGCPGDWDAVRTAMPTCRLEAVNLWAAPPPAFSPGVDPVPGRMARPAAGEDPPVLLGYSLGARLAMQALLAEPARWKAAVFVSGHPGLETESERRQRRERDREWARRFREERVETVLQAWHGQPVFRGDEPPPERARIVREHREAIARAFEVWSLGCQEPLAGKLRDCPVPQLWVAGALDEPFARLARECGGGSFAGRVAVVPACGHRVPLQKPRELAECVRAFLEGRNPNDDVEASC